MRDKRVGVVCKECGNTIWYTKLDDNGNWVWECSNCWNHKPYTTRKKHSDSKESRLNYFLNELSKKAIAVLPWWDYYHYQELTNMFELRLSNKLSKVKIWNINYHIEKLEEQIEKYSNKENR
jgi:hypothetical protein